MTTSFRVGKGIGIAFDTTLALFEPLNGALAESLWELVGSGAGIDELLEELSATGLRSLGSFAMAQFEESQTRIVVRGSAGVRVEGAAGPRMIAAEGVRTWVEEVVDGVNGVVLALAVDDAKGGDVLPFRVERGLLPADMLQQGELAVPQLRDVRLDWTAEFEAGQVFSRMPPAAVADVGRTIASSDLTEYSQEVQSSAVSDQLPAGNIDDPEIGAGDEYDEIYGRTMARSVHGAAVHSVSADADAPQPESPEPSAGLIQGIPSAGAATGLGDHDGRTMTKAQIAAMRSTPSGSPQAGTPSTMGGPTVQALMCPSQHPNPPQLSVCRVCFAPLASPPVQIARPHLGSLRFSNGATVGLDRPVLIGRNPKVEGGLAGEIPQLVRLDVGPGLSRTHASIRLEGWQVLLEDLNSANGTIVRLPNREPRRLHAGEPVLLEVGADVDLGGEINCVFEA